MAKTVNVTMVNIRAFVSDNTYDPMDQLCYSLFTYLKDNEDYVVKRVKEGFEFEMHIESTHVSKILCVIDDGTEIDRVYVDGKLCEFGTDSFDEIISGYC